MITRGMGSGGLITQGLGVFGRILRRVVRLMSKFTKKIKLNSEL